MKNPTINRGGTMAKKTPKKTAKKARGSPEKAVRSLIITVSDDRTVHDVARDLKAAGLDVDQVLEHTRTVTGSAHPDAMRRLRGIKGVVDVSPDHPVDIGPPGAPIS
jgi:hypothetical protein